MHFFLVSSTACAVLLLLAISFGPQPTDGNLASNISPYVELDILSRFKTEHGLKDDFDLPLQSIKEGSIELPDGTQFVLSDVDIPVTIFAGECFHDGQQEDCPPVSTYENAQRSLSISLGIDGDIDSIIAKHHNRLYLFEKVTINIYTYIPTEAYDVEKIQQQQDHIEMNNNIFEHMIPDGIVPPVQNDDDERSDKQRLLRGIEKQQQQDQRNLQVCDPNNRIIDLALAYDAGFCAEHGGTTATAESRIAQIVNGVRMKYELDILCMTIRVSYLEGFCNTADDPYVVGGPNFGLDDQPSGCSSDFPNGPGRLQAFLNFWNADPDRTSIVRDTAHLITGYDFNEFTTAGCATRPSLCNDFAYGVNRLTKRPTDPVAMVLAAQIGILAHEIGHNVDGQHSLAADDSIMCGSSTCLNGEDDAWTSANAAAMQTYYDGRSVACRESITIAPTQSSNPSISPTDLSPTISIEPSTLPSAVPSTSPSNEPSISLVPSSSPSSIPSVHPSFRPSLSAIPSSLPTNEPSLSLQPSSTPSNKPSLSVMPSSEPSTSPSVSNVPTIDGTTAPTNSAKPSSAPSNVPSAPPSVSTLPSSNPSAVPTMSLSPSEQPTTGPSFSAEPSLLPTSGPSFSAIPSEPPSQAPSSSMAPSRMPSISPSISVEPSVLPSPGPSSNPSNAPSKSPSNEPSTSLRPSSNPSETPLSSTQSCSAQNEFNCGYTEGYFSVCVRNPGGHKSTMCLHMDVIGDREVGGTIFPGNIWDRKLWWPWNGQANGLGNSNSNGNSGESQDSGEDHESDDRGGGFTIQNCGCCVEDELDGHIDYCDYNESSLPLDTSCASDPNHAECGPTFSAVCIKKNMPKAGRSYHYRQHCLKNTLLEDIHPGDRIGNHLEIASCGCCTVDEGIAQDIENGFLMLTTGRARKKKAECPSI